MEADRAERADPGLRFRVSHRDRVVADVRDAGLEAEMPKQVAERHRIRIRR